VSVPCPAITIVNATQAAYGIEHIVNTSICSLSIFAVDQNGNSLPLSIGDHT